MNTNRRGFIKTAGLGLAALGLFGANARSSNSSDSFKIGMCDWNVRNQKGESGTCRPDFIPIAAEAHLKGIQVSVGYLDQRNNDTVVPLRDPAVRNEYLELGKKHGIQFHSVAAGSICNSIALGYEPESAIYVVDALEAAAALGAKNILIAFFGNGDLRLRDSTGAMRNISDGPYHTYELDAKAVGRVVRVLKQIAPRAEDLGVAMGLENTLSADQNLEIIERIGSEMAQVYYDIANSTSNGYDVPSEIRRLGNDRICEIHLKDNGKDVSYFEHPNAEINWPAISKACKDIGYDKWYVLEESGRKDHFIEDTRANVAFSMKYMA